MYILNHTHAALYVQAAGLMPGTTLDTVSKMLEVFKKEMEKGRQRE